MRQSKPPYRGSFRTYSLMVMVLSISLTGCFSPSVPAVSSTDAQPISVVPSATPFPPESKPVELEMTAGETEISAGETETTAVDQVTNIPDPANYQWSVVFTGFTKPVDLVSPPKDSQRILVVEQIGVIWLIQNGSLMQPAFLDIRDRISAAASEQGLLGIALHPQYAQNRFFYLNYTDRNGDTVIARFTASENGETADPQSEQRLMQVEQPYANHNGGGLAFGPDGYLYIGLGDGGSAGDPQDNAQNLNTLLGKLLRIDIDQPAGYAIPSDNPLASDSGKQEIWAFGLRNPWRFTFDALTGDLYIGDVGQNIWEEVDFLPGGSAGGANFGWSFLEGSHPYRQQGDVPANLVNPIVEYDHDSGCSITGGHVYRGQALPEWQGVYLYGDFCRGTIWGLRNSPAGVDVKQVAKISGNISSFGVDGAGEIYALEHKNGDIYKLVPVE